MAMMGWVGMWSWDGWFAMGLLMVIFWGLVAASVFGIVRSWRSPTEGLGGRGEALRLLDERFARGEINEDEYLKRRGLVARR
jgi:putative membrane protein